MFYGMQVSRTHELVMIRQIVFGMVITKVGTTWLSVDDKFYLAGTIADPVETNIDCFGPFLLDRIVSKDVGSGIVDLDRRGWLCMAEFKEEDADGHGLLFIGVGGSNFGLNRQTHDIGHDAGDGVNRAVELRVRTWRFGHVRVAVNEKIVPSVTDACMRFR